MTESTDLPSKVMIESRIAFTEESCAQVGFFTQSMGNDPGLQAKALGKLWLYSLLALGCLLRYLALLNASVVGEQFRGQSSSAVEIHAQQTVKLVI